MKLSLTLPSAIAFVVVAMVAVAFVAVPMMVGAQAPTGGIGTAPTGGVNIGSTGTVSDTAALVGMILGLVNWVAWFVALVAVLFGLYSGVLFITAGGDDEKVTKAKNILLYAIVGIVVAILAFSIVSISRSIAGV